MNFQKTIFILSILGILFLIFLAQSSKQTQIGTIESVQYSNTKTIIQLQNNPIELIIFDTNFLNLKKDDQIEFQGRQDTYNGKKQIIIEKLYPLSN